MAKEVKLNRHTVKITTEEKVIFPKAKITKGEFVEYYQRIASTMLPYIKNRLLTMQRFPNGVGKEGFYQKDASKYFPKWIKRFNVPKKEDGIVHYVVCNNAATLVYLANQLMITAHVWLSSVPKIKYPDKMIFDLDPSPGVTFTTVRWAAKKLKEVLEALGLNPFIMTTGSKGVHIVVPLKPAYTFEFTRAFAYDVAHLLVLKYPKKLTIEMRKNKRGKRVFVDYLRNSFGATGVAPYSVRARKGAPVATPFEWDELSSTTPQKYTIKNIFRRLARRGDVWKNFKKSAQTLKKARKQLDVMLYQAGIEDASD